MTHPYVMTLLARAKLEGLSREAAAARLASGARVAKPRDLSGVEAVLESSVTLRAGGAEDDGPLARLAALDSSKPLAGPVLVAEVGGEVLAALSLRDGAVVADPFHPTAALAELLRTYSHQLDLRAARRADAARPTIRRLDPIPGDVAGGKTR
jgi:hypothetical protein